ncbi:hypothetical protein R1flu_015349 [Riccia fluitans]|uniref:Uncharacterized protein n=1 Tax=Riccia fluitans TaxID=41844 RepID=A0ABD1YIN4_9MARC
MMNDGLVLQEDEDEEFVLEAMNDHGMDIRDETARQFFPVEMLNGSSLVGPWVHSRFLADDHLQTSHLQNDL